MPISPSDGSDAPSRSDGSSPTRDRAALGPSDRHRGRLLRFASAVGRYASGRQHQVDSPLQPDSEGPPAGAPRHGSALENAGLGERSRTSSAGPGGNGSGACAATLGASRRRDAHRVPRWRLPRSDGPPGQEPEPVAGTRRDGRDRDRTVCSTVSATFGAVRTLPKCRDHRPTLRGVSGVCAGLAPGLLYPTGSPVGVRAGGLPQQSPGPPSAPNSPGSSRAGSTGRAARQTRGRVTLGAAAVGFSSGDPVVRRPEVASEAYRPG